MSIAYNFAITSIPSQDNPENVSFDIYFFTKDTTKLNVLRVTDIYVSFFVHRIPGWTINQTMRFIENTAKSIKGNDFIYEYRDDLRDSCYTILNAKPFEYVEIFSKSPALLKKLLAHLSTQLLGYYKYVDTSDLDAVDQVILRQTETPFRNTAHSTSFSDSVYWFSRTFSVPFVGFNKIHLDKARIYTGEYLRCDTNKVEKMYIISANDVDEHENKNVSEIFEQWEAPLDYNATEMNQIVIASYDIETYNPQQLPDFKNTKQYIFCIGIAFFHLQKSKPFVRFSLITKGLVSDESIADKIKLFDANKDFTKDHELGEILESYECSAYIIQKEYSEDDPGTIYISLDSELDPIKNEQDLVGLFIDLLNHYSPHLIAQFNGWGFDCQWINSRAIRDKDLERRYLQVFSTYMMSDISNPKEKQYSNIVPKYRSFQVKIEGKVVMQKDDKKENFAVRAPVIQSLDVMKLLLKADPKRFSQNWKLDYMLDSYHIKNPYNGKALSKSGLTIENMFKYWDADEKLYEIAFYCLQDSWICATMLIERSSIIDKLAMSTITYTSFEDSIYRADGHRVSCLNAYYGWWNGFAYMDEGYEHRIRMKDENWKLSDDEKLTGLGRKKFDCRVVIGGAVRNVHSRRCTGVVAADFSSMYPSQYRSGNVASCTHVDNEIIEQPEKFGLEVVKKVVINDMFRTRTVYFMKHI